MGFGQALLIAFLSVQFAHGVPTAAELKNRLVRTQGMMKEEGLDALLITMATHHIYFTGIQTEFFASPTRSYYLVIPAEGQITAVVPGLIAPNYEASPTVGRMLAWSAPNPDDDGISLLKGIIQDLHWHAGTLGNITIGAELGAELALRMPQTDYEELKEGVHKVATFTDASMLLKKLRLVKSDAEVATSQEACRVQSAAMENVPNFAKIGMTEKQLARMMRIELLKNGADRVDYIALATGAGGINDIVRAPTERKLQEGDVLFIDAGTVVDDYFCDFNRVWYAGWKVPDEIQEAHGHVYNMVEAGIAAAVPGATTEDIYNAMVAKSPAGPGNVGRMGHSVGLAITEWPSVMPGVKVTLEEGMVFAIEPSLDYGEIGQFLVHEEDIVIRKGGAQLLSVRGPRTMPLITLGLAKANIDV